MTIVEFLLARIAEDEAVASAATGGPWRYDPTKVNSVDGGEAVFAGPEGLSAITIASTGPADDQASMDDGRHIARYDPTRVLAECAAKRRIATMFAGDSHAGPTLAAPGLLVCTVLATVYADHPDYDPAWAREAR